MITDLHILCENREEWKMKWKKNFFCTLKPNTHAWDWTQDNRSGPAYAPDESSLYHADSSLKHMVWKELLGPACPIPAICLAWPCKDPLASEPITHSSSHHKWASMQTRLTHTEQSAGLEPYLGRQIIYKKILCIFKGGNCSLLSLPSSHDQCPRGVTHVLMIFGASSYFDATWFGRCFWSKFMWHFILIHNNYTWRVKVSTKIVSLEGRSVFQEQGRWDAGRHKVRMLL